MVSGGGQQQVYQICRQQNDCLVMYLYHLFKDDILGILDDL